MNTRQRKSASSRDSMRKMLNVRNYSTPSHMAASHPFSSLGFHMPKCAQGLISLSMVLRLQLQQGLATIMGSLADRLVVLADTLQVELVEDIATQIVEGKVVEAMVVGLIHHKDGVPHRMVQVACLLLHLVEGVADMELVLQIILKVVVHMVVLVLAVAQT